MKKGILFSLAIGATAIISATLFMKSQNTYYSPRVQVVQHDDAYGSIEYINSMRVDPTTGKVDPQDEISARAHIERINSKQGKKSALGLNWSNLGPNNIGGRTRAILVDKDNSNIIYSACVSGGLFKTTTGGSSWAPVNDSFNNLAVNSLCQAPNGDIYFGTGEGLYYAASGTGGQGILGAGIYKSVDGGLTFSVLPSTIPAANIVGSQFASVGQLATDPTNSDRIYACTTGGFLVSDDAGTTWSRANSGAVRSSTDMAVASNGNVWFKEGSGIYKSDNGDAGSFTLMTGGTSPITSNSGRMKVAVSPQDPNYVYVATSSGNTFSELWQTKDAGDNWTLIGQQSAQLDPLQGQAGFGYALAVSPIDKERIFIGGVDFWQWSATSGWSRVSNRNDSPTNPFYVHADNHEIKFDPKNGSTIYVGNDGGIFRSTNNGFTWTWLVKEYVTTQFYKIGVGVSGEVIGGTQDNGTIYLDPNSVEPRKGLRTIGIDFRGSQVDGDGGFAELSRLNQAVSFKAMQRGIIGRSIDNLESYTFVLDDNVDPNLAAGDGGFANFITPYRLWEKLDDKNSWDSISFKADTVNSSLGFGNGGTDYTGTVPRPQSSTKFVASGFEMTAGFLTVTAQADGTLSGDGTGTFDEATGNFSVSFVSPVNLEIRIKAPVRYEAGDTVNIKSATNELPIVHMLSKNLAPNEFEMIQDPVQSMFFVGLTGLATSPGAFDANEDGGIWMTRGALTNVNLTPKFFHVAKIGVGATPRNLTVSPDGDALWVGFDGSLRRYSNLTNARDSASTSVDDYYVSGIINTPNSSVIVNTSINIPGLGGRAITDIDINPNDPDKVVVTVGNYGSTNYVYFSNNGTSSNPTFTAVQGDLAAMPVYTATFNSRSSNLNEVIIGTDAGIFTTDDISSGANTVWIQENSGLATVPVFDLVQDRAVRFDLKSDGNSYDGSIYAGTHGRGIYKSTSTANLISNEEQSPVRIDNDIKSLNIFPNPANDFVKVGLDLENTSNVLITVRDISGRLVKTQNYKKLNQDVEEVELSLGGLKSGNYIITVQIGNDVKSGKLMIKK